MDQVRFGPQLITRLLEHLEARLDGCAGAGLTVWAEGEPQGLLMAVGVAQDRDDRAQVVEAGRHERQVCQADVDGFGLVAVPGSWGNNGPVVLTVYLDHPPSAADLKVIEEYEPMLTTAAAVVEFCAGEVLRADQMVTMVRHRRLIEQAKGLVMAASGRTAGDSFAVLVRASQHANVKLRDLCAALVVHVCGSLDETDALPVSAPSEKAVQVARRTWAALQRG